MPTSSRRLYGVVVTVLLAVAGALVAGVVFVTSGKASGVNLTTAKLVPADAGLYVAINTDLSSGQWVDTFKLIERLGQKNPQQKLHESASAGDVSLDWDREVTPFLGGDAAIYLHSVDLSSVSFQGGVAVRCKDAAKALKIVEEKSQGNFDHAIHNGTGYDFDVDQQIYVAKVGDHLIGANSEGVLFEMLDVQAGRKNALAAVGDFKTLRDELAANFLAFAYINTPSLTSDLFLNSPAFQQALRSTGTGDLALRPSAAVVDAQGSAFKFQTASIGKSGTASPITQPHESRFARMVPQDTTVFTSTNGLAQIWEQVKASNRQQLDQAIRDEGQYDSLDDLLKRTGQRVGLNSLEDVLTLLTGETALAAWFPNGDQKKPQVVLMAEVKDQQRAKDVAGRVTGALGKGAGKVQKAGAVDVTVFAAGNGMDVAYAITDGYLALGTLDAVKAVLAPSGPGLSDATTYRHAVSQLGASLGTFAYVDVGAIIKLEGGIPLNLDRADKVLKSVLLNFVEEHGIDRFTAMVTIED